MATDGAAETVEISGHIIDEGVLSSMLDDIRGYGGDYAIVDMRVGKDSGDTSTARIEVRADTEQDLQRLLMRLQTRGANMLDPGDLQLMVADADGVFPDSFYSTTNLATQVWLAGRWVGVEQPEMDCGLEVFGPPDAPRVRTVAMSDVRAGMQIVCSASGVRVIPLPRADINDEFGFMDSEVSSEKPQAVLIRRVADGMRAAKAAGKKVLWVGGPAIVHTGAAPALVAMVDAGFVDVLFAGNALATHDIESSLYGTSLGVDLGQARGVKHGHEHHIRAINQIRRCGSIVAAVDQGVLTGGVMPALVRCGGRYVLVGSVRDDGPLPEVYTDVLAGQRAMRAELYSDSAPGETSIGYCLMVATMLHSVATGNILPASIPLVCVDINPATVTKLADRGSSQAQGIVTDVGLFLHQLAAELTSYSIR